MTLNGLWGRRDDELSSTRDLHCSVRPWRPREDVILHKASEQVNNLWRWNRIHQEFSAGSHYMDTSVVHTSLHPKTSQDQQAPSQEQQNPQQLQKVPHQVLDHDQQIKFQVKSQIKTNKSQVNFQVISRGQQIQSQDPDQQIKFEVKSEIKSKKSYIKIQIKPNKSHVKFQVNPQVKSTKWNVKSR